MGLPEAYKLDEIEWFAFTPFRNINIRKYQLWGRAAGDIADINTTVDITADLPGWEAEMISKGWVRLIENEFSENYTTSSSHKIVNETKVELLRVVLLNHFDTRPGRVDIAWGGINLKAYF